VSTKAEAVGGPASGAMLTVTAPPGGLPWVEEAARYLLRAHENL
jgi:hypothetical protein